MEFTLEELITAFYKEVAKEKFPKVSREELGTVCRAPSAFIKFHMKRDDLPTIQVLHLGKFAVSYNKAQHLRAETKEQHYKGWITDETYAKRMEGYEKLMARLSDRDKEKALAAEAAKKAKVSSLEIIDDTEPTNIIIEDDTEDEEPDEDFEEE